MALATLANKATSETGIAVAILHPSTNLPLGLTITVCGSDSATFKKVHRQQLNRRLELQARGRNKKHITAEELEAENLDMLVACTKSWKTGDRAQVEFGIDEWLDCTPENARRLYDELAWLKEQIDQAIGDRDNFLQK